MVWILNRNAAMFKKILFIFTTQWNVFKHSHKSSFANITVPMLYIAFRSKIHDW